MRKIFSIVFLGLLVGVFTGCSVYYPSLVTNAEVPAGQEKIGKSTCRSLLGITFGKCMIAEAVKNAGITQVQSVDQQTFNILIYASKTTIVRGK